VLDERADDDPVIPLLDAADDGPVDCVASVVTVTVYTRRERFANDWTATQDVRGVLRVALDRDFPELEAIRLGCPTPARPPESDPIHRKAPLMMRVFLALILVGLLLSIVGAIVEGLLWLTAVGIVTFVAAAAYAALARRTGDRVR
jgi:hypothetical protein